MKWFVKKFGFFILIGTSVAGFAISGLHPMAFYLIITATLLLAGILERVYPYEAAWNTHQSDTKQDLFYALSTIILSPVAKTIATYTMVAIGTYLFQPLAFSAAQPVYLQVVAGLVISGLLPYWYHRLSHTKSFFLWKVHAIHHSPERVYWLNGLRFHPVNAMLNVFLGLTPLLLLGFSKDAVVLTGFINNYVALLNHANIDFRLGMFNYVFNMNEVHRWHHSNRLEEGNTNYSGGALVIWDILFGTYYFPSDRMKNKVGLTDESKHTFPFQSIRRQLCYPFCKC